MTGKKHKNNKSRWVEDTPEKLDYINETLYEENMKLKDKLTKYKRAFEILKDNLQFRFIGNCFQVCINNHWYFIKEYNLEKERDEYELLEELMNDE